MTHWLISHEHLATLMGTGATGADAEDMAELLTERGYPTRLSAHEWSPAGRRPIPEDVWDESLLALVALHTR